MIGTDSVMMDDVRWMTVIVTEEEVLEVTAASILIMTFDSPFPATRTTVIGSVTWSAIEVAPLLNETEEEAEEDQETEGTVVEDSMIPVDELEEDVDEARPDVQYLKGPLEGVQECLQVACPRWMPTHPPVLIGETTLYRETDREIKCRVMVQEIFPVIPFL